MEGGVCRFRKRRKLESLDADGETIIDDMRSKFAAAKALPSVVGILSRNVPADVVDLTTRRGRRVVKLTEADAKEKGWEIVYWDCGIIIDSDLNSLTLKYVSTVITVATPFVRTNHVHPPDIKVDVYLWDGNVCNAKVLACDFHYNLAALRIESDSPLPTATLRCLDDVVSFAQDPHQSFQLRPHSNLFKISPGTKLVTLSRCFEPDHIDFVSTLNTPLVGSGVFWATSTNAEFAKLDCNELYWVKDSTHPVRSGGAVVNYLGEVIGLLIDGSPFLPINIVSSWWKHYKSCGQYPRPWIGVEIANLHSSCSDDLLKFMRMFPDVTVGVVVTKIAEDSPAYCSGIRPKDVIVKCDDKLVRSSLEFFEIVWNKVEAESVELDVLREGVGETLKLSLTVKETSPDKFYQWHQTYWKRLRQEREPLSY